jgi:hypothetical protein
VPDRGPAPALRRQHGDRSWPHAARTAGYTRSCWAALTGRTWQRKPSWRSTPLMTIYAPATRATAAAICRSLLLIQSMNRLIVRSSHGSSRTAAVTHGANCHKPAARRGSSSGPSGPSDERSDTTTKASLPSGSPRICALDSRTHAELRASVAWLLEQIVGTAIVALKGRLRNFAPLRLPTALCPAMILH